MEVCAVIRFINPCTFLHVEFGFDRLLDDFINSLHLAISLGVDWRREKIANAQLTARL